MKRKGPKKRALSKSAIARFPFAKRRQLLNARLLRAKNDSNAVLQSTEATRTFFIYLFIYFFIYVFNYLFINFFYLFIYDFIYLIT